MPARASPTTRRSRRRCGRSAPTAGRPAATAIREKMEDSEMFHIRAGRARVGITVAVLIGASPGSAADTRSAPQPVGPDHYERDVSDIAKYVKAFESPERHTWQKPGEVVSLLQLWPGNVVADIGAGTGHFEPY